jgi:hypothetical protein
MIKAHGCMRLQNRLTACLFRDGGVLKGLLKPEDEISNEEMISTSEEQVETDETRIGFSYLPTHRRYVYNPKFNVYPETA